MTSFSKKSANLFTSLNFKLLSTVLGMALLGGGVLTGVLLVMQPALFSPKALVLNYSCLHDGATQNCTTELGGAGSQLCLGGTWGTCLPSGCTSTANCPTGYTCDVPNGRCVKIYQKAIPSRSEQTCSDRCKYYLGNTGPIKGSCVSVGLNGSANDGKYWNFNTDTNQCYVPSNSTKGCGSSFQSFIGNPQVPSPSCNGSGSQSSKCLCKLYQYF